MRCDHISKFSEFRLTVIKSKATSLFFSAIALMQTNKKWHSSRQTLFYIWNFLLSWHILFQFQWVVSTNYWIIRPASHHAYFYFASSSGLRIWIKLIMSETYLLDGSKHTEYRVEVNLWFPQSALDIVVYGCPIKSDA